eukprot:1153493-Pelagomonas_calceolata.AAC.2
MGLHKMYLGTVGLNILSLGYAHIYALLELCGRLSILWLLNTVLHCDPGKHGAVHKCVNMEVFFLESDIFCILLECKWLHFPRAGCPPHIAGHAFYLFSFSNLTMPNIIIP